MKVEWNWSNFLIAVAAFTTAVVVVIPVVERGKDIVFGQFDTGFEGGSES